MDYSTLNMNLKLRDLEKRFIEMKTNMERKVIQIIEENPKRILQQLRMIEEKETDLWADNMKRHNKNFESLETIKVQNQGNMGMVNKALLDMRKEIEDLNFKNTELRRNMQSLTKQSKAAFEDNIIAIQGKGSRDNQVLTLQNELKIMKERMNIADNAKNKFFEDMMGQYQSMNDMIVKNERDYFSRLRSQKDEIMREANLSKKQFKNLEEIRMEKVMGDNEYVKGLVDSLERRVKDEVQKRLNQDFEIKQWMERQMQVFKDEIKNDEREILENENKFIKEVQETISSLNTIVKNTREQTDANIAATQTMMTENLRNVAKTMEILKENLFTKMGVLDSSMVELNKRMANTIDAFNEHTLTTNNTLQKEFNRVENVNRKLEALLNNSLGEMNKAIEDDSVRNANWKKNIETKNHNFFKEITNALKIMKKQLVREKFDRKKTDDALRDMMGNFKKKYDKMFEDVDQKFEHKEEIYDFKLKKNNEKWENNLQLEVDKILDNIAKTNDNLRDDFAQRLQDKANQITSKFESKLDRESSDIRDFVLQKKGEVEEGYNTGLKNLENKLTIKWNNIFDEQRLRFEDAMRDFNKLKNDLLLIKKDYHNAINRLETKMENRMRRDLENMRRQFVNRLNDQKDEIIKFIEELMKKLQAEIDASKTDIKGALELAKADVRAESSILKNEIMRKMRGNTEMLRHEANESKKDVLEDMELIKKMLMERMNEMNEATKSLARALVLDEAAQRAKEDEHIIKLFDRKIINLEKLLRALIEQTADKLRIEFDEKLAKLKQELEDFRNWVLDEFSNVRTESEEFKQEYYARNYSDHLMNLAFQKNVNEGMIEIRQEFAVKDAEVEELHDRIDELDSDLKEKLEQEIKDRKKGDEELQKNIDEESEIRRKEDVKLKDNIDENKQIFDDYKDLNEDTWEEFIAENEAQKFLNRLKAQAVEASIYNQMQNLYDELSTLGFDFDEMNKRIEKNKKDTEKFKEKVDDDFKEFRKDFDENKKDNERKFDDVSEVLKKNKEEFNEFSDNVSKNFQIAEQSLTELSNFLNAVDSKTMIDQLVTRACLNNHDQKLAQIEAQTVSEMAVINQHIDLQNDKLKGEMKNDMKKLEKKVVEDEIPRQVLGITNALDDLKKNQNGEMNKVTEDLTAKINEHEAKIENNRKGIKDNKEKVEDLESTVDSFEGDINALQKDMVNVDKVVGDTNAQFLTDKFQTQAELGVLRENVKQSINDIYDAIDEIEQDQDNLSGKLAKGTGVGEKELKKLKDKLKDMEKDLKDVEKDVKATKKLKGDVDDIKKDLKKIKKDQDKASKGNSDKGSIDNKALKKLEDKIDNLENDVEELNDKLDNMSEKSKGKGRKKASDEDEDFGERLDDVDDEIEKMKKQLGKLEKGKKKGGDSDDDDSDKGGNNEELEERVEELENELEELKDKIGDKSKKSSKKKKTDDSDDEDDEKVTREEFDELKDELDELKQKMEDFEPGSKKRSKKSDKSDKSNADYDERFEEIEGRLDDLENQSGGKKSSKKKNSDDSDDDGEKVSNEDFEELKDKVDDILERLEEVENKSGKGSSKKKKSDDSDDDDEKVTRDEFDELKDRVDDLENKSEKSDKSGSKKSGGGNEEEIEELKEKIDELEEKLNEKIEELEEKIDNMSAKGGSNKSGKSNNNEDIDELKQKIEEMEEDIEELKNKENSDKSDKSGGGNEELKEKVEELEEKIEALENKSDKSNKSEGDLQQQIDELKENLEEMDQRVEELENKGGGSDSGKGGGVGEERIEELENKIEELEEEIEGLKDGDNGVDAEAFEELRDKVDDFEEKLDKIEEIETKVSDLEEKIEELEEG